MLWAAGVGAPRTRSERLAEGPPKAFHVGAHPAGSYILHALNPKRRRPRRGNAAVGCSCVKLLRVVCSSTNDAAAHSASAARRALSMGPAATRYLPCAWQIVESITPNLGLGPFKTLAFRPKVVILYGPFGKSANITIL